MIVTTLDHVTGQQTGDTLGLVRGTCSWTRRIAKSYAGGIRSVQLHGLAELDQGLAEARNRAMDDAKREAGTMGGTAIVGCRTEVKELGTGVYLITVTGTAVKTYRLPASVPAFGGNDELPGLGLADYAKARARASSEGSLLRH